MTSHLSRRAKDYSDDTLYGLGGGVAPLVGVSICYALYLFASIATILRLLKPSSKGGLDPPPRGKLLVILGLTNTITNISTIADIVLNASVIREKLSDRAQDVAAFLGPLPGSPIFILVSALIIWRSLVLYPGRRMMLGVLGAVGLLVTFVLYILQFISVRLEEWEQSEAEANLFYAFFIASPLSILVNLFFTSLFLHRVRRNQIFSSSQNTPSAKWLIVLWESGMIYLVLQLVSFFLVFFAGNSEYKAVSFLVSCAPIVVALYPIGLTWMMLNGVTMENKLRQVDQKASTVLLREDP